MRNTRIRWICCLKNWQKRSPTALPGGSTNFTSWLPEGTASIDLLVEVAISLNTTLDFLILGVLDTPRERELNAQIKKQNQNIQNFKSKLNSLIDELDASA